MAIVKAGNVTLKSEEIDLEFTCSYDDNCDPNEAEIIVYNLSDNTIKSIKNNSSISITAGYKNDTGLVFAGYIDRVSTKWNGPDRVTTIKAYDSMDLSERTICEKTYKKGTKASCILKDLVGQMCMPVGIFRIRRDHCYKEPVKISGNLMENVLNYAEVCGTNVYIRNTIVYVRHITDGDSINFIVCPETGLINSPEGFEEEMSACDYKKVTTGYKMEMLLQHRMTTAAIVNVKSKEVNGRFRVRAGTHRFSPDEAISEVEVI